MLKKKITNNNFLTDNCAEAIKLLPFQKLEEKVKIQYLFK